MNIPGDETKGFNSVFKVHLASLLHGRRSPLGHGKPVPGLEGIFECVGGSVGKHNILPTGPGALSPASATSQTSLVTPLQVLADICPHPSPSQAGRAPGAGSAQGCRCVGSASTTLGSPSCHQPGPHSGTPGTGKTSKGKASSTCLQLCV